MPKITDIYNFKHENLIIEKPSEETANTTPPMKYLRANIKARYPDGNIGDLIIVTETLFSKGIKSGFTTDSGEVTGYVLPLNAYDRDGATPKQAKWVIAFENLIEACKEHVFTNRKDYKKPRLDKAFLNKFASSVFWWPEDEETGLRVLEKGPTLYPKLLYKKATQEIKTRFYRMGTTIKLDDPLSLLDQYGLARAALKIESIFASGDKIKLQVKVLEVDFKVQDSGMDRLLPAISLDDDDDEASELQKDSKESNGSVEASDSDSDYVPSSKVARK